MSKRKLPKAIRRTDDPEVPTARVAEVAPVSPAWATAEVVPERERTAQPAPMRTESLVAPAALPMERVASPTVVPYHPPERVNAVRRRSQALAIVERHATYSAAGGFIPVPIVNVAGVTAIILRMVRTLSKLYGVPFERDRARTVVVALAGGTMPTGFAAVTTSTLYYVVPGAVLLGLAVSAVTATACTRKIGRIFVEHFERGETLDDLSLIEGRAD
jgi:uncharacterized protein (DUF697 family)